MKSPAKFWGIRIASVVLALAGAYVAQGVVLGMNNSFVSLLFVLAGLYVTLAVSLNLINGITGQFSMGHAAFYMIGAYTAALVTKLAWKSQMAPMGWVLIMVVVGALAAAIAGLGVNLTKIKVSAFVLGSAFAGAAGALYSHGIQFISPESFSMDMSFLIVTMVVLGGTGSITGTSIAAVVLFLIPEKLRDLSNVKMGMIVGIGIALIITVRKITITSRPRLSPSL